MPKQFELKANDKNLLSTCVGLIKTLLETKKGRKCFDSFDDTFAYFQERVTIPTALWERVSKGVPKWQQAIRNAAKVHRDKKTPDALTQGELMALVHGGFALPDQVPEDREVVKFPDIGGFKFKSPQQRVKGKKAPDFDTVLGVVKAVVSVLSDEDQVELVLALCKKYGMEVM